MLRRFFARSGVAPRRAVLLTVMSASAASLIPASAHATNPPVKSPAVGATSPAVTRIKAPITFDATLARAGIFVPTLWHAPAFHAPIRLQAARLAARAAEGRETGAISVAVAPPPIDWRLLAGLDYLTGKTTDTLKALNGKEVRVPGFVVPLDDFMEDGAEFLLVPYYGACVHTPPPPPNQIIFVQMANKKAVKLTLFDAVWMHGTLKIATVESPYGTVGFTLSGTKMEPYSAQ